MCLKRLLLVLDGEVPNAHIDSIHLKEIIWDMLWSFAHVELLLWLRFSNSLMFLNDLIESWVWEIPWASIALSIISEINMRSSCIYMIMISWWGDTFQKPLIFFNDINCLHLIAKHFSSHVSWVISYLKKLLITICFNVWGLRLLRTYR